MAQITICPKKKIMGKLKLRPPDGAENTPLFSVFDLDNPCSVINLVNASLHDALQPLKDKYATWFDKPEATLRWEIKPDERDERLRLNFWDEYNYQTQVGGKIRTSTITKGVCSIECWENYYLKTPKKLLWMVTPPRFYSQSMKYILNLGLERLTEMMSAQVVDVNGKLDVRAAGVILKAFQLVDLRVKGAIAQKVQIDQRTMSLNADVNAEKLAMMQIDQLRSMSPDDLLELEQRAQLAERAQAKMLGRMSDDEKSQVIEIAEGSSSPMVLGNPARTKLDPIDRLEDDVLPPDASYE